MSASISEQDSWRTATMSGAQNCVQVKSKDGMIIVGNSRLADGPYLSGRDRDRPIPPSEYATCVGCRVTACRSRPTQLRSLIRSQARWAVTSQAAARTHTPSGRWRAPYCPAMTASTRSASTSFPRSAARLRIMGMPRT